VCISREGQGCLPERLIVAALVLPVLLHEGQEVLAAVVFQDTADVGVLPRLVAVLGVLAVAEVRPEAMDGPVICGSGRRSGVPELDLEDLALDFRTAGVLDGCGVVAG